MNVLCVTLVKTPAGLEARIELKDGNLTETAASGFEFAVLDRDVQDIQWYLEDYLKYPVEPGPAIAGQVEDRMREIGSELFAAVFSSPESRYLWSIVKPQLDETRIEIADERDSMAIPWELMRDPVSGIVLSVHASAFVRTSAQPPRPASPAAPRSGSGRVRILLAICRPRGRNDVGFRATARHIVSQLQDLADSVDIEVLRPPTFSRLGSALWSAFQDGRPYNIVHFDGHGSWADLTEQTSLPVKQGSRGYVVFEGSGPGTGTYVDGEQMGDLLKQCGVPVLLLNACRSAHRDPLSDTDEAGQEAAESFDPAPAGAYGSFAQEVCAAGVSGVVAMSYNIYVVTAAQFVANLYRALLAGQTLGAAVAAGRRQLASQPMREITARARPLQDWVVPVVYESSPLTIFAPMAQRTQDAASIALGEEAGELTPLALADEPQFGFYGRDTALFELDRAFTSSSAVLLHGYAGEGKTAAAIEFARWYARTGGMSGPVIYTSFGSGQTAAGLIDEIGAAFAEVLAARGISWVEQPAARRQELAEDLFQEFGALWIWDNLELTADPAVHYVGEAGLRLEIADLLGRIKYSGAKLLVTSTLPESWLGDSVHRIQIDPMPMMERLQLARAVASRHGAEIKAVENWVSLLLYTQGNPLTIILAVTQAARSGLTEKADLDSLVARLAAGETPVVDDMSIKSSRIGNALGSLLETEFDSGSLAILSVLSMFRSFVSQSQLMRLNPMMEKHYPGSEPTPYSVHEVVLDSSHPLHPLIDLRPEYIEPLFDRCLGMGLLTPWKIDGEIIGSAYHIHPAIASYLRHVFTENFGASGGGVTSEIAYCYAGCYASLASSAQHAMSRLSAMKSMFVTKFSVEEFNLVHALRLAVVNEFWSFVPFIADGLGLLYKSSGRMADWVRVVTEISPHVIDQGTFLPVPGREDLWEKFVDYQLQVTALNRDWGRAERLSRLLVAKCYDARRRDGDMDSVYKLADSLMSLGEVLSVKGDSADAISAHREAVRLYQETGDRKAEASGWLILGDTLYRQNIPGVLDEIEQCYEKGMELGDQENSVSCTGKLASVAYSRFLEGAEHAVSGSASPAEVSLWADQCVQAADLYERYLEMLPKEDVRNRAYAHSRLGQMYGRMGEEYSFVMEHFNRAIELHETSGNPYYAGHARREASLILVANRRYREALLYAQAALVDFQSYGVHATEEDIEVIHKMISGIRRRLS